MTLVFLTPTVYERLARCNTQVHVDGLAGGLTELFVTGTDGARHRHSVDGIAGDYDFLVPPLAAGDTVVARQTVDGGPPTPESPAVVVEDVHLPVDTGPRLPESVDPCAHCVAIDGIVPGADVELSVAGTVIGRSAAGRDGSLCMGLPALVVGETRRGQELTARMIVCGVAGPTRQVPFLPLRQGETSLPPYVGPLVDCQSSVPLGNLLPGAEVIIETETAETLGGFESCWTSVNLWGIRSLHHRWPDAARAPDRVRVRQRWRRGAGCERDGLPGPFTEVGPLTDELLRPVVCEVLVAGDRILRVEGQLAGATLVIHVERAGITVDYGPRPAGNSQEIALNEALRARDRITVTQELCTRSATSVPVTVQALPATLARPMISSPLWECGAAVRVSNLEAGALIRVYQEGFPIGVAWVGTESSTTVVVRPSLRADASVTAVQFVGGQASAPSAEVNPGRLQQALAPRLLEPITTGESEVWLSHVAPGSVITVRAGPVVIGEVAAAESIVRVPVTFVGPSDTISASARLCGVPVLGSNTVRPIRDPGSPGPLSARIRQRFTVYAERLVLPESETHDLDSLVTPVRGLWYEPDGWTEQQLAQLPLVVIVHGYWRFNEGDTADLDAYWRSFRGYRYLAEHLISWGMRVFSLDMTAVNSATLLDNRQGGRATVILRALEMIAETEYDASRRGNAPMRVALIGHSMAGEAVVIARSRSRSRTFFTPNITGVVSIAPTYIETMEVPSQGAYLQMIGSHDVLIRNQPMFRAYDRAEREKTHYWIYGARHNGFNRSWLANNDDEGARRAASLDPETARNSGLVENETDLILANTHERLAKALITPFLVQTFSLPVPGGAAAYSRYQTGAILPPSIRDVVVHTQHAGGAPDNTTLVDNFGDDDTVLSVTREPIDRTRNRMGLEVRAEGAGLIRWEDVSHETLWGNGILTPHSTISTRIQWANGLTEYTMALMLPRTPSSDSVLSMRVGQAFGRDVTLNPVDRPLDLFVVLRDAMGAEAVVRLGAVAPAPFPEPSLCPMRTVRIPIDAFTAVAPPLALDRLESLVFRFAARATGDVFIDDVEFTV